MKLIRKTVRQHRPPLVRGDAVSLWAFFADPKPATICLLNTIGKIRFAGGGPLLAAIVSARTGHRTKPMIGIFLNEGRVALRTNTHTMILRWVCRDGSALKRTATLLTTFIAWHKQSPALLAWASPGKTCLRSAPLICTQPRATTLVGVFRSTDELDPALRACGRGIIDGHQNIPFWCHATGCDQQRRGFVMPNYNIFGMVIQ